MDQRERSSSLRFIRRLETVRPLGYPEVHGVIHDGVPWIRAWVDFGGRRTKKPVWFLVDTGADVSVLSTTDAFKIGIDEPARQHFAKSFIHGYYDQWCIPCYAVPTGLIFRTDQGFVVHPNRLVIPIARCSDIRVSLLGRNVLRHFDQMRFEEDKVVLKPSSSGPFKLRTDLKLTGGRRYVEKSSRRNLF